VSDVDVVGAAISLRKVQAPLRYEYSLYDWRPDPESVDAFQAMLTWLQLAATAEMPVGVVGGVVSLEATVVVVVLDVVVVVLDDVVVVAHVPVFRETVALNAETFPALSTAETA
jgi:hypothetical protein